MTLLSRPATRAFRRPAVMVALAAGIVALDGCKDSTSPWPSREAVEDVVVTAEPLSDSIVNRVPGQTRQLNAVPIDAKGWWVDVPVTWSSSDNQVASVSASGVVTFNNPGVATITASAGGKSGTIGVGTRWPVASVVLSPLDTSIRMEGAFNMSAELRDEHDNLLPGRTITWTSSNQAVASVSSAGRVAGLTEGVTTITATSENVSTSTQVTVAGQAVVATVTVTPTGAWVPAGQTIQMTATARAGSGTIITGGTVTWSSSDEDVATVNAAGLVTVHAHGTVSISAEVEGVTGSTSVQGASVLANGVAQTSPSIVDGQTRDWAVVVPAGLAEFTVQISGGTSGDADIYVFPPGVTPNMAGSVPPGTWVCRPWDIGSDESCRILNPAAGNWRIRVHAYPGEGDVVGLNIVMMHP